MTDFILPELGESITAGDVLRVLVAPGDAVAVDQPVLELETDKATLEVPSSVAGVVTELKVRVGDTVRIGQPIFAFEAGGAAASAPTPAAVPTERPAAPAPSVPAAPPPPAPVAPPVLAAPAPQAMPAVVTPVTPAAGPLPGATMAASVAAPAAPSVRRLARELGLEVDAVPGTGPHGRISLEDVKAHAKHVIQDPGGRAARVTPASEPLPDFSRWGGVERRPMNAVRRKTAEHLSAAWAAIPHVTQQDRADITALDVLRKRYARQVETAGGHLTITAIAVKVVASALKAFPQFNASVDLAAGEFIVKQYVHIGVAVDTDRGLLVPVIRNADTKSILAISVELAALSEKARARKLGLDDMQGGCFSVSNLGGIGGSYFTPIVNAPEVAILGISRARTEPVFNTDTGGFAPRLMLPLSLSYDHRAIDGAEGARFLRWIVEALEEPFVLALQG